MSSRPNLGSDFATGAGTLALAAVALISLYTERSVKFGISGISSTDFPKAVAWVLLGLGALLVGKSVVQRAAAGSQFSWSDFLQKYRRPLVILVSTLIYVLVLNVLGFFVSSTLFLLWAGVYLGGRQRLWLLVVVTLGSIVVLYLVFARMLHLLLPTGFLV
jgi:putative tricarboxylic transport membrane protein